MLLTESFTKTKEAATLLKSLNAYANVVKVSYLHKLHAGKERCNHRHRQRCGPLIVYNKNNVIVKAFRNLLGVELVNTEGAFGLPDKVFRTFDKVSTHKRDYLLLTSKISNPDVTYLINSDEINSVIHPAGQKLQKTNHRHEIVKQECLKNTKKPKQPSVAGKAFTANLFTP
ncbi:60S ribosomal protein L4-B [Mycena venus]|uniref:60S ribosomal protein L4-B n=1 Tax=Mycena venus TaxID=2733690 RepID=A0A8H7DCK1_9AGAR|nr:60S ribosomal protein L4-B [Mycena venus]